MSKKAKELVTLVCRYCRIQVVCSPEIAKRALEGRVFCVACEGALEVPGPRIPGTGIDHDVPSPYECTYTLPKHIRLFGEVGEDSEIPFDPPEGWTVGVHPEAE